MEDTLVALKEAGYDVNEDDDDFMSLDGDASLPSWENWVDALEEVTELAAPSGGAAGSVPSSGKDDSSKIPKRRQRQRVPVADRSPCADRSLSAV